MGARGAADGGAPVTTPTRHRETLPDPATLAPLRDTLTRDAAAQARALVAAARDEARRTETGARTEADALLEGARRAGERDGAALAAADRAAAARRARAELLRARREVFDEIRARARGEVARLLADPAVRDDLAAALRSRLGARAQVSPTGDGGLRATTPDGRTVEASVAALVDDAVARLDLDLLWDPS